MLKPIDMPELPEVEIVCRNLNEEISDQKIKKIIFERSDLRFAIPRLQIQRALKNLTISHVERRAKYILINMKSYILLSHLGMTGSWRIESNGWEIKKHDHLWLELGNGKLLIYNDPRRFGFIELLRETDVQSRFVDLGMEPLNKEQLSYRYTTKKVINLENPRDKELIKIFRNLKTSIKTAIMNQKYLVGVGNIYASEALFKAGLNPLKICSNISEVEYKRLLKEIRAVLIEAIQNGGSSISDYKNLYGSRGAQQLSFSVYDRAGERCKLCSELIIQQKISQRSTFWCPSCQK